MAHKTAISADEALVRLRRGNAAYVASQGFSGAVSRARWSELIRGQAPFALVVACSDSRVMPEAIFGCRLGDLFVIRVAGNVVGGHALGSIEYAVEHLGVRLVVVLGHTHCGAVGAAIAGEEDGFVGMITRDIADAIAGETDPRAASIANALAVAAHIRESFALDTRGGDDSGGDGDDDDDNAEAAFTVVPALYDIETGLVEWPG